MADRQQHPWDALGITEEQWEAVKDAPASPEVPDAEHAEIEEARRHYLRVIWRETKPPHRRATTFVPIDRSALYPDFLAAMEAGRSKLTVYVRDEAQRSLLNDLRGEVERLREASINSSGQEAHLLTGGAAHRLQVLIHKHSPEQYGGDR